MNLRGRLSLEQLGLLLMGVAVLAVLAFAAARAVATLRPPAPVPTPESPPAPPAAVLLQDELDRDLQGVVILVVQAGASDPVRVGTAFLIDGHDHLLTSADLVRGATAMRVIDPSGGNHSVALIGVDESLDLAELRVQTGATALLAGDPATLNAGDPVVLVASAKNAAIAPSTPATIAALGARGTGPLGPIEGLMRLTVAVPPAGSGAPVVGTGGKVLGVAIAVRNGTERAWFALPISAAHADLVLWSARNAAPLPMAPVPASLVLRGIDETVNASPTPVRSTAPRRPLTVQSVQPNRAFSSKDTVIAVHGTGFVAGPALRVRFTPNASLSGSFDALKAAVADQGTITATVPAGMRIQDYAIEVINGDGSMAGARLSFTVVP